jgi:hypothetical protein
MAWPRLVIEYLDHLRSATPHVGMVGRHCTGRGLHHSCCAPGLRGRTLSVVREAHCQCGDSLKRHIVNQPCWAQALHAHDIVLRFCVCCSPCCSCVLANTPGQIKALTACGQPHRLERTLTCWSLVLCTYARAASGCSPAVARSNLVCLVVCCKRS